MSKVRRLVGFGVELAELVSAGSRRYQHRLQAFKALQRIYDIIYDSDDFLADTVVLELQAVIDTLFGASKLVVGGGSISE